MKVHHGTRHCETEQQISTTATAGRDLFSDDVKSGDLPDRHEVYPRDYGKHCTAYISACFSSCRYFIVYMIFYASV